MSSPNRLTVHHKETTKYNLTDMLLTSLQIKLNIKQYTVEPQHKRGSGDQTGKISAL